MGVSAKAALSGAISGKSISSSGSRWPTKKRHTRMVEPTSIILS
jgi:hypothetical protein